MQAIIRQGGKQYLVSEGTSLKVSKLDAEKDSELNPEVLAVYSADQIKIGAPVLTESKVTAKVIDHVQGPKLHVYKFKPKSNYRRKIGYRDQLTIIQITAINP